MTDQQQPQNQIDFAQAKAAIEKAFSATIGGLAIENAILEKQLVAQAAHIEKITANELRLKARLSEFYRKSKIELSPEVEALAAEAEAIISTMPEATEAEQEKAAPVEAAEIHPIPGS